jgi:hypothetical protein
MGKGRKRKNSFKDDPEVFKCLLCPMIAHGPEKWDSHLRGKDHRRMVARAQLNPQYDNDRVYTNEGGQHDEILSDNEKIIEGLRLLGHSIPIGVRNVHQVTRTKGYLKKKDYIEITENSVLVESGDFMGLIIFDFYSGDVCDEVGKITLSLCYTAGWVARSKKKKKGGLIFMFGARLCNGKFGRYSQTQKAPGGGCLPGYEAPRENELDFISGYVATTLYRTLRSEVPSFMDDLECIVPHSVGTCASRVGHTPFTTMGTSLNYFVQEHDDKKDTGHAVISWFEKDYQDGFQRSVFRFRDFGVFFRPRQGTMTLFDASKVWHGTKRNDIRYSQLGVVLCVKKCVLEAGQKRMENIGFQKV